MSPTPLPVAIPDTTAVNTAWGPCSWLERTVPGEARYSRQHGCFVAAVAPGTFAVATCAPRIIARADDWVGVEDCVGVTVAELVATVGVSAIELDVRRLVYDIVARAIRAGEAMRVPSLAQIRLGFDGRIVAAVAPRLATDITHLDSDELGLLSFALDLDGVVGGPALSASAAAAARRRCSELIASRFPQRAEAWRQAVVIASTPPPVPVVLKAPRPINFDTPVTAARAALALQALLAARQAPSAARTDAAINLVCVVDGDDADFDPWWPGQGPTPKADAATLAKLASPARVTAVAAAVGQVLAALSTTAPSHVSLGAPQSIIFRGDVVTFDEDARLKGQKTEHPRTLADQQFRYIAPEKAVGADVDVRASLYIVGVHLYQLLCGRHPFFAETSVGFAFLHAKREPTPPSTENPGLPSALSDLTLRLMAKAPGARFATPDHALIALANTMGHDV